MISIIVPVYNVEKYIVKCLESIVNQDYKDFELLIVNDGTKDDSIKLANEYLKDKDINYQIINKDNGGLASARNTGIRNAKGDALVCIDSDDCISKDFLSCLYDSLKDNDFSFCNFKYVKEQTCPFDSNTNTMLLDKERLIDVFLRRSINFVVPSMMFRKDFLINNNLLFNENIRFSEDQPFIWEVILKSTKCIYLYRKMYGYYLRSNSIMTSSKYEKIASSFEEYKNYITLIINNNLRYKESLDMIIPRWSLGTLYTSAKLLEYKDYLKLYELVEGKEILKRINNINDIKSKVLAYVCNISPKLLYTICRLIKLEK